VFLVDDILFFPVRSLVWIFREIHSAAAKDLAAEPAAITAKLGELYMMLETGKMTEAEFDAAEKALLDRLDLLQAANGGAAGDADTDDDDADDDDDDDDDDAKDGNQEQTVARSRIPDSEP